jgi:endonuclease/exonuclease/phosphatase family metal-dependent hydrolase
MKPIRRALAGLALAVACTDQAPLPTDPSVAAGAGPAATPVTVMTQNMYVGTDVDAVIRALLGGGDPTLALLQAVNTLLANDLDTRLAAMADNIARHRPQVVALQEASRIELGIPSPPFPTPIWLSQDFVAQLLAALAARGLEYEVAAANQNFAIDLTPIFGVLVRLTDLEVLLVDHRVEVLATSHDSYSCPPLCVPLGFTTIVRGWARVDARIAGRPITFVGTHLESGSDPLTVALRAAQAQELAGTLSGVTNPVVLMGDLNDVPGSSMNAVFQQAGFTDLWTAAGSGSGNTCCHQPDLRARDLFKRIDYVMVRGGFQNGAGEIIGGARIEVVDPLLPAGGPLWPSDHGGLVAHLPPAT